MATYVYCLVVATRKPKLTRVPSGLPGMGPVRLLAVDAADRPKKSGMTGSRPSRWLAVADAPAEQYREAAINRGLTDLDWVARRAIAHEAVVEKFIDAPAVLPMKLFTIFGTDARALAHVAGERTRIDVLVKRVANHHEWGIRLRLDRNRALAALNKTGRRKPGDDSGVGYLARKKVQRDASAELAERARETVAALYDRVSGLATLSKRRAASELPVQGGPLLLDAAFLVPQSRSTQFDALVSRESRALTRRGYQLTLSGPWPPYSFIQD